jgi:hypothetical protein
METTTRGTPTSSGDGPGVTDLEKPSESIPGTAGPGAGEDKNPDLLRADGSLIPVTSGDEEEPRREPAADAVASRWRSRAAERLAEAAPSEIALSAFAAGLVAGIILGAISARR